MSTTETQSASIKELHRSRDERILAGVAGGLGRYFDISPTFFRIGFAILTLVGGAGILLYVAAWLVIPDEGASDSIVSEALRRHRDRPWLLVGVGLVAIALVSLFAQADFWPNSGFAWTLLLLGALAIMFAQRRADDGTPPDDSTPPTTLRLPLRLLRRGRVNRRCSCPGSASCWLLPVRSPSWRRSASTSGGTSRSPWARSARASRSSPGWRCDGARAASWSSVSCWRRSRSRYRRWTSGSKARSAPGSTRRSRRVT